LKRLRQAMMVGQSRRDTQGTLGCFHQASHLADFDSSVTPLKAGFLQTQGISQMKELEL